MNYIVKKLKEKYLDHIDTTKDLIYKKKTIDAHAIADSYAKNANTKKDWTRMKHLNFNGHQIYFNPSSYSEEMKNLVTIFGRMTTLVEQNDRNSNQWIISEIQNSLWIEGVRSSKKKIVQIAKDKDYRPEGYKEKIISNYNMAIQYISRTENIDETNLNTLYRILTSDIDMKEEELDGYPYRLEDVKIGDSGVIGSDAKNIKKEMDGIFDYINNIIDDKTYEGVSPSLEAANRLLAPILVHYVFEIIHPYYDMNGRTGRLLSLWVATKLNSINVVKYLSESINKFKDDLYYKAFTKSSEKGFKNDVTYFMASIMSAIIANNISLIMTSKIVNDFERTNKITLSSLEQNIIHHLIVKSDNKNYVKEEFLLGVNDINPGQLSTAFKKLVNFKIIREVNSKPKKYSFIWNSKCKKIVDILTELPKHK